MIFYFYGLFHVFYSVLPYNLVYVFQLLHLLLLFFLKLLSSIVEKLFCIYIKYYVHYVIYIYVYIYVIYIYIYLYLYTYIYIYCI